MTRRTRLFLWGAAATLVIGLSSGLIASYMGVQNLTLLGGGGPSELAYVPEDTSVLAYADIRDVMDSELRRRLADLQPGASEGAERFRTETGIDLERDIDYLVAAASPPEPSADDMGMPAPLILARGRFDQVRIEGLIRDRGGVVEDYAGTRLFAQERLAVAFVEPDLAAIGPPAAVRRAIDTKASGVDVRGNSELMAIVADIDANDAWAVARFDSLSTASLPAEVTSQLPAIRWVSAAGVVGAGVEGQLRVEARDAAGAQNLREVIQGLLALVRMQAGQNAAIEAAVNSLQLGGDGATVSLSFSVPSELIDVLMSAREGVQARAGQPAPRTLFWSFPVLPPL